MNRYRRPRSKIVSAFLVIVFFILTVPFVFADTPLGYTISKASFGLSLEAQRHGSALGGFYAVGMRNKFQVFAQGKILNIVGDTEFPVVDWYTGWVYKTKGKNLILLPVTGGFKFHPFIGQIANNFSPLLMVSAGPTFVLDLKENVGFVEQWKNLHTTVTFGAFVGIGIDFLVGANSYFGIILGYDVLPMSLSMDRVVDERRDYSGTVLKFMFGRRQRM